MQEVHLEDAVLSENAGDWASAIAAYRQVLKGDPETSDRCTALIRLAHCLMESGRSGHVEEAERYLEEAHRSLPKGEVLLEGRYRLELGRLQGLQGDPRAALLSYMRASDLLVGIPDEHFAAEIVLANAECGRGELDSALQRLQDMNIASLSNAQHADYLDALGAVYLARGEVKAAVEVLDKALDLDQSSPDDYSASKSRLLLAQAHLLSGNVRLARPLIERALRTYEGKSSDAGRSEALALMGLFFEETEDFRLAAQYYQAGLDLDRSGDDVMGQVRARRALGRIYRKTGDYARAAELFAQARELIPRGDDVEMAALWTEEGLLALEGAEPDYAGAIRCFIRALEIAEEDGDVRVVALAQRNLAKAKRENSELTEARELLEKALPPLRARGDLRELNDLLDDLGEVLLEQGEFDEAVARLEESLELDRQFGKVTSEARGLLLLGRSHLQMGHRQQAREYFEEALDLYRRTEGPTDKSAALQELGAWYAEEGHLDEATRLFRESLAIDLKRDDRVGMIRANRAIAGLYRRRGDFSRAREHLDEAEDDLRVIVDATERALLQLEEGKLVFDQGSYREANDLFESARHVFAAESAVLAATCQRHQAKVATAEGRYADAIALLESAKMVFLDANDNPELDELYDDEGDAYLASGQIPRAVHSASESLRIGRQMGWERGKGRSHLILGRCAIARGDFSEALKQFEDALAVYSDISDDVGLAKAYEHLGDWLVHERNPERDFKRALFNYNKARHICQKLQNLRGVGRSYRKSATVYRLGEDFPRAADALETAEDYLHGIDDPREIAPFEFERGALHAAKNEHPAAILALRRAIEGFRELGQTDEVTKTYYYLITSHQANHDFRSALDCMREMGLEESSMWGVLVKELNPFVASQCEASFASGRYQDAVVAAYIALEDEFRRRSRAESQAELKKVVSSWFNSERESGDVATRSRTSQSDQDFCTAAFELFRNPAAHRTVDLEPVDAFAQLGVAHLIAQFLGMGRADADR
jgi:tetratricopeptide (TPR) repeat protein